MTISSYIYCGVFTHWNIMQLLNLMRKSIVIDIYRYHIKASHKMCSSESYFYEKNIYVHIWMLKRLEGHKTYIYLVLTVGKVLLSAFSWNFSLIPPSNSVR